MADDSKIDEQTLEKLKQQSRKRTKWAAYRNEAWDSSTFGHVQFLAVGPDHTHKVAPPHMPDTQFGLGWKYRLLGWVNLETGLIDSDRCRRCGGDLPRGTYHAEPSPKGELGFCSVNCEKESACS